MIVASCRANFTATNSLAKANAYRNFTNPALSTAFSDLTKDEFLAQAASKHVCILVHGYNNPMENVMNAYWGLVQSMRDTQLIGPNCYGLVVGFAWPGFQSAPGFFPALKNAKKSGPFLSDLINDLGTVAQSIDIQTHSLGARVALTALSNPKKVLIENLITSAPAVDNDILETDRDFFASLNSCKRCFIYHSKHDSALKFGFKFGDIFDGIHDALGLTGPANKEKTLKDNPNLYVVDCSGRVKDHGGYRNVPQYYEHWKKVRSGEIADRYGVLA